MSEHATESDEFARRLSRMLFSAREQVEMWADVVERKTGRPAEMVRDLVVDIDAFRAEQGWSPHGFGGETGPVTPPEPPTPK